MRRGFTLMEVLLVLALVAVVAGFTLPLDLNALTRTNAEKEELALVSLLQTARMDAMSNRDGMPQQVKLSSFHLSSTSPHEVTFSQLSGSSSYEGSITLLDAENKTTKVLTLTHEGRISW